MAVVTISREYGSAGSAVILGRGSYVALAGLPGVLNVRLRAPFEWRVERVLRDEGSADRTKAEAAVREGDKVRSSFLSSVYGIRWDSSDRFDLVMDTSRIGVDKAAAWIAEAARQINADPPRSAPGKEPPDPVLDQAVADELKRAK